MSLKEKPQKDGGQGYFLGIAGMVLALIFVTAYFFYGLQPSLKKVGPVIFKISKGESFRNVGARLSQDELVRSISVFKMYAILLGRAHKLQPGSYVLASTMSVPEIVGMLSSAGGNEAVVTIPEGSTLKDVDAFLTKAGVIDEGALIRFHFENLVQDYQFLRGENSLEGFLFPDTYRFEVGSSLDLIVTKMLKNFEVKAWPILEGRRDWYEDLILASYLEREVPLYEDRMIVAGILLKRIRLGMPLQVDATLSYAKCNGKLLGCLAVKIGRSDLGMASPYNTYKRLGWTPTPIANPGLEAIRATVQFKKTPYLYYFSARGSGKTIFSGTLEEHNINKAKYL